MKLQQHENILIRQQEQIENIKKTLYVSQKQIRPDLQEVTRKNKLSPKSKTLYETVVKMKKQKKHLKRLLNKQKKQNLTKSIELCTTHKSNNATAHIRQQFVNMIVRNHDKAPQVHFQSK